MHHSFPESRRLSAEDDVVRSCLCCYCTQSSVGISPPPHNMRGGKTVYERKIGGPGLDFLSSVPSQAHHFHSFSRDNAWCTGTTALSARAVGASPWHPFPFLSVIAACTRAKRIRRKRASPDRTPSLHAALKKSPTQNKEHTVNNKSSLAKETIKKKRGDGELTLASSFLTQTNKGHPKCRRSSVETSFVASRARHVKKQRENVRQSGLKQRLGRPRTRQLESTHTHARAPHIVGSLGGGWMPSTPPSFASFPHRARLASATSHSGQRENDGCSVLPSSRGRQTQESPAGWEFWLSSARYWGP